jgi:hypothetical protein
VMNLRKLIIEIHYTIVITIDRNRTNRRNMKANELRIGNLVNSQRGISRIVEISNTEISYVHFQIPDEEIGLWEDGKVEPIPLTADWLLKFGFEKEKYPDCFVYDNFVVFVNTGTVIGMPIGKLYVSTGLVSYTVPLEYVHQLQNLYFALTGKELTPLNIGDK